MVLDKHLDIVRDSVKQITRPLSILIEGSELGSTYNKVLIEEILKLSNIDKEFVKRFGFIYGGSIFDYLKSDRDAYVEVGSTMVISGIDSVDGQLRDNILGEVLDRYWLSIFHAIDNIDNGRKDYYDLTIKIDNINEDRIEFISNYCKNKNVETSENDVVECVRKYRYNIDGLIEKIDKLEGSVLSLEMIESLDVLETLEGHETYELEF